MGNWFLCLFLNTLPMEMAHRVMDCVMHEGSIVLFRVALSILQAKEAALLLAETLPDAYVILRTPCDPANPSCEDNVACPSTSLDTGDLFERMYGSWLDSWSTQELE